MTLAFALDLDLTYKYLEMIIKCLKSKLFNVSFEDYSIKYKSILSQRYFMRNLFNRAISGLYAITFGLS